MTMITTPQHETHKIWRWNGLGAWNYYFFIKFALLWAGYLTFHPLANLVLLAFIVFPLPDGLGQRIRNWTALAVGLLLFYHESWLPDVYSSYNHAAEVFTFSGKYKLELLGRMLNWNMIAVAFVLLVIYLFISQWVRVTVFTILAVLWLNLITLKAPEIRVQSQSKPAQTKPVQVPEKKIQTSLKNFSGKPANNENIDAYLNQFYKNQESQHTEFPQKLSADAEPFDLIFIHISSFAWSDIKTIHQENNPIWSKFDILFEAFNGAASYSNPAALRLLQGSCGQPKFADLFAPVDPKCYLIDNLVNLGFTPEIMLDHTGIYADFLKDIRKNGGLKGVALMPQEGIRPELTAFYGGPIFSDHQTLQRWLEQRHKKGHVRNVTYFNSIALHDGNRSITSNKPISFAIQGKEFLDEIDTFFDDLKRSGRKTMVVFISAHGRNYSGDKLQIPALRNIPTPAITHVPVGIKLIGLSTANQNATLKIKAPSSYLALSEIIARLVNGNVFNQSSLDLDLLSKDLPQTEFVSENEKTTIVKYQDKFYIRLHEGADWVPLPQ